MNWKILRVASVIGLAVLAVVLLSISRPMGHTLTLKAYFSNGMALCPGAPVRLAGVDVGSVKSVRARPEMKETPVEVVMSLNTSEELRIPNDSTVSLATAGILGEAYVAIDSRSAAGPPVQSGATLKAVPTASLTTKQMLDKLAAAIKERCDCDCKKNATGADKEASIESRDPN